MAWPVIAAAALTAASAGLSAYSQYKAGKAQKEAYGARARIAAEEARTKKRGAEYEEALSRRSIRRMLGTQRALYARAGVDITSGSPLMVMAETAAEGEREAQAIRWGGKIGATRSLSQARLERMYGKQAGRAGTIGGISTFLSGLGQAGLAFKR